MYKFYRKYCWNRGKPKGIDELAPNDQHNENSFRIVVDPYFKRYTIEFYKKGVFQEIVYDSALFDFRQLKPVEQNAWKKEILSEMTDETICLIKNQDDRIILIEKYLFTDGFCTNCIASYPNGQQISMQKIFYKKLGDSSNSTILYDRLNHPVLIKEYDVDEKTGEFTHLLKEIWSFDQDQDLTRWQPILCAYSLCKKYEI